MTSSATRARLDLEGFGEREAFEAEARGFYSARVLLSDGRTFDVVFYDVPRLQQDLASEEADGRPFLAEPGLIVVTSVTAPIMTAAVETLHIGGFFSHFMSKTAEESAK